MINHCMFVFSLIAATPPLLLSTPKHKVSVALLPEKCYKSIWAPSSISWPGGRWAMSVTAISLNFRSLRFLL